MFQFGRAALNGLQTGQWSPSYECLHVYTGSMLVQSLIAVPPLPETQVVLVDSRLDSGSASLVRPLIRGGDPRADALLSYLTQGAFDSARRIGSSIADSELEEILSQKRRDPASAVISGYYSLRADHIRHPDWVKNLADWFPLVPDGAVQYGWCLMRQPTPDTVQARQYFLEAARRGIPMYTYGVRLLYDGLSLFAERAPDDKEVADAFYSIRRIASATDWQSGGTSLILPSGTEPPVVILSQ
jgi:hypothetical protein